MIGRLPTAAAVSLLMAICGVCGIRRIAAEAMAKKKVGAIQSKVNSFFRAKKKPQKQAGEDIEI